MGVEHDTRQFLVGGVAPQRHQKHVGKALRVHAHQCDPIPQLPGLQLAAEHRAEGERLEAGGRGREIEQELVAGVVLAGVAPVVAAERAEGAGAEPQPVRVVGVRQRPDALRCQRLERHAQGEGVVDLTPAVVEKE